MTMRSHAAGPQSRDGVQLGRYLPLSVGVTLAVTAVPLVAVAQLGAANGFLEICVHVVAAVALSMLIARALAALWTRDDQSSDLVFGDLLLWGWMRRALAERRLDAATRELAAPAGTDQDRAVLLRRLSTLLEARDPYTHGHSRRVARHAERIAKEIGLSSEQIAKISAAALVHDIGKINVPRSVLTKPETLTDAEFALVKRHAADGAAMVAELGDPELAAIVRHHHERMDGTGYPDGLAGGDIPLGARVIAVADTFDAITSTRAYRTPRSHSEALEIIQREAGTQLDAAAVAAFATYYSARRSVGLASVLAAAPQRLLSGLGGAQSGVAASVAPIAQTVCGVGGIALVGACLTGPIAPQPTADRAVHRAAVEQLASRTHPQPSRAGGTQRAATAEPHADARRGQGPATRERGGTRAIEAPSPEPVETTELGSGGGSGAGGAPVTLPPPPALPEPPTLPTPDTLPDVGETLEPVTDGLGLPQLRLPRVQLPRVQAPNLPAVELP
jgi:putative nucleotidyltransferase with HDIG domain